MTATSPPGNARYVVPVPVRASLRALSLVSPALGARLGWRLFAKPSRKPRPDRHGVFSEDAKIPLVAEGIPLAAWTWGAGDATVVLLHGWGSSARSMGGFVRPLVDAGFRVVAYDAHAHGESPGTLTSGPRMASHLVEIADRLGARHLVGHSMGTVVAGFALRAGLTPDRMALLNGPADMPWFLNLFTESLGFTPAVHRRMVRRFEEEHEIRWENCVVEWAADGQDLPVLLVHDRADPDVPWVHVERVRSAWRNSRPVTTSGLGHRGALRSRAVVHATVDFLAGREDQVPEAVTAGSGA